ncbi:MAG: hypothetical protein RR606_00535 [Oscillospiraceae bacterium]
MRKEFLLPGGAVALGIGGFFLRHWELRTAFEPDTGLPVFGMPATWCLIALSVLAVLAAVLMARNYRKTEFPDGYDSAFYAPHLLYFVGMLLAAAAFLGAGLLGIWQYAAHVRPDVIHLVLSLLCVMVAASFLILGRNNYKGERQGQYSLYLLIPGFTFCLWLLVTYLQRAADPAVLDYVYGLFAVICVVLSGYFTAGFAYGHCKPFSAVLFSLLGIYFGIVALAGADLFAALLHGGAVLYQLSNVTVFLYRTQHPTQFVTEVIPDEG